MTNKQAEAFIEALEDFLDARDFLAERRREGAAGTSAAEALGHAEDALKAELRRIPSLTAVRGAIESALSGEEP